MTKQYQVKKVALIGDCLSGGGAEKVLSLLSFYFDKQGYEVHHCIFEDKVSYAYKGSLLNLGKIRPNSNSIVRKFNRLVAFIGFVKQTDFDLVIDFRLKSNPIFEGVVSRIIYPKHAVFSVRSGLLNYYLPNSVTYANFIYKNNRFVVASKAIQEAIINKKIKINSTCIYNPIDFEAVERQVNAFEVNIENFLLAVGRMEDVKQFDQLIIAYSKSELPSKNIKLVLLGDGKHQKKHHQLAVQLGIAELVVFIGSVANPFPYYKAAYCTVLCSKNEGFPNVLLESLASATPVISFDCFSGPSEIIQNNHNGLLVENQNFEKLTQAMNQLFSDKELFNLCKSNAKSSVSQFSLDKIGDQWLDFLKNTVS